MNFTEQFLPFQCGECGYSVGLSVKTWKIKTIEGRSLYVFLPHSAWICEICGSENEMIDTLIREEN